MRYSFNNRDSLGRYGMGLPNSSFSQAQRFTVHTWSSKLDQALTSYLDLDEIASGKLTEVPRPKLVKRPEFVNGYVSGTAVTWTRCDRLDNKRISTITRKLLWTLGRQFRHFLWAGASIKVNGDAVQAIDPLFLHPDALYNGATQFVEELVYEVAANPEDPSMTGIVRVRFSELSVSEWSKLSNEEKGPEGLLKVRVSQSSMLVARWTTVGSSSEGSAARTTTTGGAARSGSTQSWMRRSGSPTRSSRSGREPT